MRKITVVFLSAAMVFSVIGCQNSPNRAGEGAVIGGLVGALGGALVGSQIQKQPAQTTQAAQSQQQSQAAVNPNQMSLQQVADLAKQNIHEDVIIDRIRLSNSKFTLTAADVTYLQQNEVSEKVIKVMQGL